MRKLIRFLRFLRFLSALLGAIFNAWRLIRMLREDD